MTFSEIIQRVRKVREEADQQHSRLISLITGEDDEQFHTGIRSILDGISPGLLDEDGAAEPVERSDSVGELAGHDSGESSQSESGE